MASSGKKGWLGSGKKAGPDEVNLQPNTRFRKFYFYSRKRRDMINDVIRYMGDQEMAGVFEVPLRGIRDHLFPPKEHAIVVDTGTGSKWEKGIKEERGDQAMYDIMKGLTACNVIAPVSRPGKFSYYRLVEPGKASIQIDADAGMKNEALLSIYKELALFAYQEIGLGVEDLEFDAKILFASKFGTKLVGVSDSISHSDMLSSH